MFNRGKKNCINRWITNLHAELRVFHQAVFELRQISRTLSVIHFRLYGFTFCFVTGP